jgi:predicted TIM-barrel fold metal-dependent hydrolase
VAPLTDFHFHLGPGLDEVWAPAADLDAWLAEMDRHGVGRLWTMPYRHAITYEVATGNAFVLRAAAARPDRLVPVRRAALPVDLGYELRAEAAALAAQYAASPPVAAAGAARIAFHKWRAQRGGSDRVRRGPGGEAFRALKFHDLQDGSLTPDMWVAVQREYRLAVLHINPFKLEHLLRLAPIAGDFAVVVAHLGAFTLIPEQLDKALDLAARHPGLYLDTSAIFALPFLDAAVARVPDRLVFGTDGPCFPLAAALSVVRAAGAEDRLRANGRELAERVLCS